MTGTMTQALVLTVANLTSLPRRFWISLSMVLSVALVVVVLIGFLAMAEGFERALAGAGSDRVAVVLGGTTEELGSEITPDAARLVDGAPAALGIARSADGRPLVSRELVVPVDARLRGEGDLQTLSLRGMSPAGVAMRANARLAGGRMFVPSANEIVVGARIAREYAGFGLGDRVAFGASTWTVVGHFEAGGSVFESELWADVETVQAAFDRQGQIQTLRVGLADPAGLGRLDEHLKANARTPLTVMTEQAFYAGQSSRIAGLIRMFGWPIALLVAVGATAGALNTMMSSVSDRAVEIATLRTLGFARLTTFVSTWLEAVALTLLGAAVGIIAAWTVFDGLAAATTGANSAQVGFALAVTPGLAVQAGLLALAIGVVGGGLPAIHAAVMPLTAALRQRN